MMATDFKLATASSRSLGSILWPGFFYAGLAMSLFVFWVIHFRYRDSLGTDDDVYRVLNGLMDGARHGTGFASPWHYGRSFSFGYILAMYRFASASTLESPQRLIVLINGIGRISAITGGLFFWLFVWLLYNLRVATVALTIFLLSPMMLELGTTGHQILPAFALFSAGAALLFLPVSGWRLAVCSAAACLFLLAGLVVRAEVILAFPFLVLAGADLRSGRAFLRSAGLCCLAPGMAAALFFLLKRHYVDQVQTALPSASSASPLGALFRDMYSVSSLPKGVVTYLLGCGIMTTLMGLLAAVLIFRSAVSSPHASERRSTLLHGVIGPLALIVPSLLFWIANPLPARHFILCLAGTAMLIGLLLEMLIETRPISIYTCGFAIVLANQFFAALMGPIVSKAYPSKYVTIPGHQPSVPMRVTIGSSLSYHRRVDAQLHVTDAFARKISSSCEAKTLILTSSEPQVFSHLYDVSTAWTVHATSEQDVQKTAHFGDRAVMVVQEPSHWPHDAVDDVLADPNLREYKIVRDPGSISVYDKSAIPPDRLAHFDCIAR